MAANGKTLTVTYGAFACTIDGYDDPMPVLRSVVAFFRELTVEDPGFGTVAAPSAPAPSTRPSPLSPEEVASLAAPEAGESRLTASVTTQAARGVLISAVGEEEEEDLLAATAPRPQPPEPAEEDAAFARFRVPPVEPSPEPEEEEAFLLTPDLRVDHAAVQAAIRFRAQPRAADPELMPHEAGSEEAAAPQTPTVDLARFLGRVEAATLADRMEAVAAHAIVVEGRDSISRPALLRAMQDISPEPLGFEEALKAFGLLLHAGRLGKAEYGRYTVADTSPYLAEARAMLV